MAWSIVVMLSAAKHLVACRPRRDFFPIVSGRGIQRNFYDSKIYVYLPIFQKYFWPILQDQARYARNSVDSSQACVNTIAHNSSPLMAVKCRSYLQITVDVDIRHEIQA